MLNIRWRKLRDPFRAFRACWGGFWSFKIRKKSYFQDSQGFPNINFWQPSLCSDVYVEDRQKSVCVWHTHTHHLSLPCKNTKVCICETWTTCLQSSDLASMLRTHNVCVCSIHNLSRPHKVLKSVCMTHTIYLRERPPCKLLKSVFVRHEISVYNPQNWRLCWEHTISACAAYKICQH